MKVTWSLKRINILFTHKKRGGMLPPLFYKTVHATGGLKDTVEAFNPVTKTGSGITFQSYNAYDMLDAVKRAIDLFHNKPMWRALRKNAMSGDFSWKKPAQEYIEIYQQLF